MSAGWAVAGDVVAGAVRDGVTAGAVACLDGRRVRLGTGAGACVGWPACEVPVDPGAVLLAVADGITAGVECGPGELPVPPVPMTPELSATAAPVAVASVSATAAVGISLAARARGRAMALAR
jgi:hypothetical protein